jgi:hypothetical protein
MNRKSSLTTMKGAEKLYPDVLGCITGGQRFSLDALHLAFGVRPYSVHAGMPLEAIVVLQNTLNSEIDVILRLVLPEADEAGRPARFTSSAERSQRIGMRSGEVGVLLVPVQTAPQTAPGSHYAIHLEVSLEHKGTAGKPVRPPTGGALFDIHEFEFERQRLVEYLQSAYYATDQAPPKSAVPLLRRNSFTGLLSPRASFGVPFSVKPPATSSLGNITPVKPRYFSVWTEDDLRNTDRLINQTSAHINDILSRLNREHVYFPLLKHIQACFERASYRLWVGEAVLIAKLMTLLLERGLPKQTPNDTTVQTPRWVTRLARFAVQEADLLHATPIDGLVTRLLFRELVYDSAMHAFKVLGMFTKEAFVPPGKAGDYALSLAAALTSSTEPVDLYLGYVPLVLGGLAINHRVALPRENLAETVALFERAFTQRGQEQNQHNALVFKTTPDLIRRAHDALQESKLQPR